MIPFEMVEPTSLKEAIALLEPQEPTVRPVAGGTALMLMMKAGVFQPSRLICLHGIEPEYARIAITDDGALRIGAMATLSEVEHDANVGKRFPVLKRAMRTPVESARAQCRARRRCAGAWRPAYGPAAGAHRARRPGHHQRAGIRRVNCRLKRSTPAITKPCWRRTNLSRRLTVPALNGRKAAYIKVTSRSADDWPALGVAVSLAYKAWRDARSRHHCQRGDRKGHAHGGRGENAARRGGGRCRIAQGR